MIKDIDWINERAPYPVKVENENLLSITTDTGKVIGAGFCRCFTIGNHTVVYFSFMMLSGERGGSADHKLGVTATTIIKRYLIENPDNILFFCHSDNYFTFALQRIFMHWGDIYVKEHPEDVNIRFYLKGKDFNGEQWHATYFISNDCSDREDIIESLNEQKDYFIGTFAKIKAEVKEKLDEEYKKEREEKY